MVPAEYWEKLDAVSKAPDDLFPELLMEPLFNPFDDRYHSMDLADSQNKAIEADPRFTRERISRIRANTKRIDQYLEWVQLYDAYEEYLIDTYGSLEVVRELIKQDMFTDPVLQVSGRPYLRKKIQRDMLAAGLVPSFTPIGYQPADEMDWLKEICELEKPDVTGEEEPDIEWAMSRKMSKAEGLLIEQAMMHYRQNMRLTALTQGTKTTGIWNVSDWVDGYYQRLSRGDYDTSFSTGTTSNLDLTQAMIDIRDEQFMPLSDKIDRERGVGASKTRLFFDGSNIRKTDQVKKDEDEFIKELYKLGMDLVGGMRKAGVPRKAIRKRYAELGIQTEAMSERELKKLEKKRRKTEKTMENIAKGHSTLSSVLKTNKLLMSGNGTIRFEDGSY